MRHHARQRQTEEPTFEEYRTARRVMAYVRKSLEESGERLTLSEDRIFSEVVFRGSAVCDPELFERSQLGSAEGNFERETAERKTVRRKRQDL